MRYLFEEYAFDTDRRELHRGADVVSVAPQVFDLLDYLIRNRERVVSKDDLINTIWNGRSVSDAALTNSASSRHCRARASDSSGKYRKRIDPQARRPSTLRRNRRDQLSRSPTNPLLPFSPSPI